jgi:hypothetical protein
LPKLQTPISLPLLRSLAASVCLDDRACGTIDFDENESDRVDCDCLNIDMVVFGLIHPFVATG